MEHLHQELSQLASNIDHYAVAVPLTPKNVAEQGKMSLGIEVWSSSQRVPLAAGSTHTQV